MRIRSSSKDADRSPSRPSRRQMVSGLFAISLLPANALTRAMCLVRAHAPAPAPLAATQAGGTRASAGLVERLMYNSLASDVRKGGINFTLNGRTPSIDEARVFAASARERGIVGQ
jgi:hypothetical protein